MDLLSGWCSSALGRIAHGLRNDGFWGDRIEAVKRPSSRAGIHLAVLVEPFLSFILDGSKTIESRFAVRRIAPFGRVHPGDTVLFKAASGPVVALGLIQGTWYLRLDVDRLADVRREFASAMRADSASFWENRRAASFATLMEVREVRELPRPLPCPKRDRRGWVVLRSSRRSSVLEEANEGRGHLPLRRNR